MKTRNVRYRQWRRWDWHRRDWSNWSDSYKPGRVKIPPGQFRCMRAYVDRHGWVPKEMHYKDA